MINNVITSVRGEGLVISKEQGNKMTAWSQRKHNLWKNMQDHKNTTTKFKKNSHENQLGNVIHYIVSQLSVKTPVTRLNWLCTSVCTYQNNTTHQYNVGILRHNILGFLSHLGHGILGNISEFIFVFLTHLSPK